LIVAVERSWLETLRVALSESDELTFM